MKCTRCDGTGFLNIEQVPDDIDHDPDSILAWMAEHKRTWEKEGCSCHICPPCSYCIAQHEVEICDCCSNGYEWYGEPGEHYGLGDPKGPDGPYASNGGLCECH